jgi:hypothetical protein
MKDRDLKQCRLGVSRVRLAFSPEASYRLGFKINEVRPGQPGHHETRDESMQTILK